MAGGDAGDVAPVSGREMYQYAAAVFRQQGDVSLDRLIAAFTATGRSFALGQFRSMAALARLNTARQRTAGTIAQPDVLPTSYYRESQQFGRGAYRFTVLAKVRDTRSGATRTVSFTISSDTSMSLDDWYQQAFDQADEYTQRYEEELDSVELADPRRRTIYSTGGL